MPPSTTFWSNPACAAHDEGITPAKLGLPRNKTAEEYFHLLLEQAAKNVSSSKPTESRTAIRMAGRSCPTRPLGKYALLASLGTTMATTKIAPAAAEVVELQGLLARSATTRAHPVG